MVGLIIRNAVILMLMIGLEDIIMIVIANSKLEALKNPCELCILLWVTFHDKQKYENTHYYLKKIKFVF